MKKLSEQVIVITGASSGIGLTTVRMAAAAGAKVMLIARNGDALREITHELKREGYEAAYFAADVGNESDLQEAAQYTINQYGHIDTWVNNAGVGIYGRNEVVSREDQRRLFETNFWGVVHGSLAAVNHMKTRGGTLINVGSALSERAASLQGIYAASKHAVKGFTESLRVELKEEGAPVSVTLINPASVASTFVDHAKNYMDVYPTLPPPIYAPELVAKAILYAAEHAHRDLYVGGAGKLLGLAEFYMPRLLDFGMKYVMSPLQRTSKPPRPLEHNNLHDAGKNTQQRADVHRHVRETSAYTFAVTHPRATQTLLTLFGLAIVYKLRRKLKQKSERKV